MSQRRTQRLGQGIAKACGVGVLEEVGLRREHVRRILGDLAQRFGQFGCHDVFLSSCRRAAVNLPLVGIPSQRWRNAGRSSPASDLSAGRDDGAAGRNPALTGHPSGSFPAVLILVVLLLVRGGGGWVSPMT